MFNFDDEKLFNLMKNLRNNDLQKPTDSCQCCQPQTSKLRRYQQTLFGRVLNASFFIKMSKESDFKPTLEVKVYEPDEDEFRNMGKYLRMIEADTENHKVGLVKASLCDTFATFVE